MIGFRWLKQFCKKSFVREFGIRKALKKLNRQLEKVADSFGYFNDI